jgi:type I restriction enzyme R subunit
VKKRNIFSKYGEQARAVLDALLQKYSDSGITSVESMDILKVDPFSGIGTPVEILKIFGGKPAYIEAIREMENALYQKVA